MAKSTIEKTSVLLDLDKKVLIELKRYLFRYGLTMHQFFGYIAEMAGYNDERLEELTREARNYKAQRILDIKNNRKRIEPESLYYAIEQELLKHSGSGDNDKKNGTQNELSKKP